MPAGPIGSCWASGSWSATAWEANTWEAQAAVPSTLDDLTTLVTQTHLPALRAAHAVGAALDSTTLFIVSQRAAVQGYDSENDINTALAKYIEATY